MNITGIDIAGVTTLIAAIGTAIVSVIKAIQALKKARDAEQHSIGIELAREVTKKERDREIETLKTEVAVLKELHNEVKERLAEGTNQFKALDDKVDTTNSLLNQILGALKNAGLKFEGMKL
jgi:septal ring factor EnvC (AmiA/AmiB activator)